ncbi:hypothetical protein P7L54_05750 [Acinetobacter bereziniae]|uniref:Uncharacterized protein n=1 Tax=Acinetobacter bereziniae LMG 1003 = CIP 70.12 TaxID=981324 RepID=N9DPQ8_ACIBZ|nr:hypothetical protein [Acinetobacter bereziniae]ENW00233.1 hypothetical protein F938_00877 [Acinetobacter bereziniae LMG 1003 = CIP 70.12]MBJ9907010.1 hypothetical protein [Acinetobacter bereziniae]MBJ9928512.1 hypothetical protein [Acinetobacter bereziniae]MDG3555454.1 hypothetical protein [Acinetobacter bereziniae]MDP6001849.1 hypothetical protein [Acinetobacter bereziniae]
MKNASIVTLSAVLSLGYMSHTFAQNTALEWKSEDQSETLKLDGVIRFNHRYESWDGPNVGFGKLYFDIFKITLTGKFDDAYLNASYIFQDQEKRSIEKAYVGYNFDENKSLEAGFVYKPFTIYPYTQNGWLNHIPFFLGYGNNSAPGMNWNFHNTDWDIKLGYYPEMLATNLRYSPESATYDDLADNAFPTQKNYQNEKRHQFNMRIVRKLKTAFGQQEFGVSGAFAQLHNKLTDKNGQYYALGVHTDNNYKRFNLQSSVIHYQYDAENPDGVNNDMTLMGGNGLTPAYFIASEGTVASLNFAYVLPIQNFGQLKAIRFYNDYSYFDKKRSDWASSQMNTTGMMFIASPFLVWTDYLWGKNANVVGGAGNATGWTSASSDKSDQWSYRINLNIGYSF